MYSCEATLIHEPADGRFWLSVQRCLGDSEKHHEGRELTSLGSCLLFREKKKKCWLLFEFIHQSVVPGGENFFI